MSDTKLLQAILDSVASIREDIKKLDLKLSKRIEAVNLKLTATEQRLTARIDKLGKSLAYLEDDTPTREEFDGLTGRVDKIEDRFTAS